MPTVQIRRACSLRGSPRADGNRLSGREGHRVSRRSQNEEGTSSHLAQSKLLVHPLRQLPCRRTYHANGKLTRPIEWEAAQVPINAQIANRPTTYFLHDDSIEKSGVYSRYPDLAGPWTRSPRTGMHKLF